MKKLSEFFEIYFNIEFGTVAIKDNYTILEIPNVFKLRILPSNISAPVLLKLRAFCIFLNVLKKSLKVLKRTLS